MKGVPYCRLFEYALPYLVVEMVDLNSMSDNRARKLEISDHRAAKMWVTYHNFDELHYEPSWLFLNLLCGCAAHLALSLLSLYH